MHWLQRQILLPDPKQSQERNAPPSPSLKSDDRRYAKIVTPLGEALHDNRILLAAFMIYTQESAQPAVVMISWLTKAQQLIRNEEIRPVQTMAWAKSPMQR